MTERCKIQEFSWKGRPTSNELNKLTVRINPIDQSSMDIWTKICVYKYIYIHHYTPLYTNFCVRKLPFDLRTKRCSMMHHRYSCSFGKSSIPQKIVRCHWQYIHLSFVMLFRRFERRRIIRTKHGHDISPTQIKSILEQFPCPILKWARLRSFTLCPKISSFRLWSDNYNYKSIEKTSRVFNPPPISPN